MDNYEKSYKGFVILVFAFLAFMLGTPFVLTDWPITMGLLFNGINLWIVLLMYIIYKGEKVYWFTGVLYEEAKAAGSERRKAYALAHLRKFFRFALLFLIFSVVWLSFNPPENSTVALFSIIDFAGLIGTAFSTSKIKL